MYPVMLSVRDRRCLVVGGGRIAARRVHGLLREGARVTLVAPELVAALAELADGGEIEHHRRAYEPEDVRGCALVLAATDDRDVNRGIYEDASAAGIWVNVADDPELCTFHVPARVRRGGLEITVSSDGGAPFATRRLRQLIEKRIGPEWAEWMQAAAEYRECVRSMELAPADKEQRYDAFFAGTVDGPHLRIRVPSDEEKAAWLGYEAPADETKPQSTPADAAPVTPADAPGLGFVSLIGAGPGDAGLLTVRGRDRLRKAEAVAYDRLAETTLPTDLSPEVELHCVGKTAGHHPVPQDRIADLLIKLAREGKRVVRLKGGDPFVFGRGGEEAKALRKAGIPFEVIPCVTAGVAVPAYAGIPVTSRGEVVRFTMVTAHEAIKQDGPQVRWDLLAQDPHATLVGYMGVTALPKVVKRLREAGMSPDTPAAMIERGTTSRQRVVLSTIEELNDEIQRAGLKPPALFVIGPAVRHARTLDWFGKRPLLGERIGVFAPADEVAEALELAGAEVVSVPNPVSPAARIVMAALPLTAWLLRNDVEVDAIDEERERDGWTEGVVGVCMGPSTAARAIEVGWQVLEEVPENASPAELIAALKRRRGVA